MTISTAHRDRVTVSSVAYRGVAAVLGVLALTGAKGCNDCDFWAYCEGNVRVVCGAGVDQQVGRKVTRTPCEAPNPVCVAGEREALCVRSAEARCPFPSPRRCDGSKQITCTALAGAPLIDGGSGRDDHGYEVEFDCASVKDPSTDAGVSPWVCMPPTGCVAR
jgi:hypothetical protein